MESSLNNNNDKEQCESVLWGMPWRMPRYILTLFFIFEEILRSNGHTNIITVEHFNNETLLVSVIITRELLSPKVIPCVNFGVSWIGM